MSYAMAQEMSAVAPEQWRVGLRAVAAVVGNVDVIPAGDLRVVMVVGDEVTVEDPATGERLVHPVHELGDGETMQSRIAGQRPWLSWMSASDGHGALEFRWYHGDGSLTAYELDLDDPGRSRWRAMAPDPGFGDNAPF